MILFAERLICFVIGVSEISWGESEVGTAVCFFRYLCCVSDRSGASGLNYFICLFGEIKGVCLFRKCVQKAGEIW